MAHQALPKKRERGLKAERPLTVKGTTSKWEVKVKESSPLLERGRVEVTNLSFTGKSQKKKGGGGRKDGGEINRITAPCKHRNREEISESS